MSQPNSNHNPKHQARVTRTSQQRSPEAVRRLGRALIALARAQLEAEAQAQSEAKAVRSGKSPTTSRSDLTTRPLEKRPLDSERPTTGDAA